jgi:2-succinyl-5-enolpyruvyl-6-hydroxy-3-cyclohexene-1-carboxylate synthase
MCPAAHTDVPVTPAATFCATVVDEWVRQGLTHAVVSPGSRSTPMALALLGRADVACHVVLDERSAGFVALGIARATSAPVPVLTTSGSATANLYPAVVEADQDLVPLVLCTADRPPELHGVGAPQTIDQQHLYGGRVRRFVDAGVPDDADPGTWRSLAQLVWAEARGRPRGEGDAPGPVQCNLPFRDPLVGRAGALPPAQRPLPERDDGPIPPGEQVAGRDGGTRVLVVCGPVPGAEMVAPAARRRGWPVLLDPRVPMPDPTGISRADALLRVEGFAERARPEVVLRFGPLPASKVVGQWLDGLDAHQIGLDPWGRRFDPGSSLDQLLVTDAATSLDRLAADAPAPDGWLELWSRADAAAERVLGEALAGGLGEPAVARAVTEAARERGGHLVVSSSMPVRDVEWYGVRGGLVHSNRGANGIDGVVSTTVGVAIGSGDPTVGLLGDLAFLHDTNGLLVLKDHPGLDVALVVVDNGGGGIFHFLPQHEQLPPADFERLYGTPHGLDLVAVAEAHGVRARRLTDRDELDADLRSPAGPRVLVVPGDRDANQAEHTRLQGLVAAAVEAALLP